MIEAIYNVFLRIQLFVINRLTFYHLIDLVLSIDKNYQTKFDTWKTSFVSKLPTPVQFFSDSLLLYLYNRISFIVRNALMISLVAALLSIRIFIPVFYLILSVIAVYSLTTNIVTSHIILYKQVHVDYWVLNLLSVLFGDAFALSVFVVTPPIIVGAFIIATCALLAAYYKNIFKENE